MQAYENVYVQWSFNIFTLDSRTFGFGGRQANEINWRSNRCLRIYDYSYKNEIRTSRFTINFEIRFDNPNLWMYRIEDIHEKGSHKGNNGVSFCILWSIPHLKKESYIDVRYVLLLHVCNKILKQHNYLHLHTLSASSL